MSDFSDLFRLVTLAFLEILLSADNAVVLGVLTHSLPVPLRRKALFVGVLSAFFLRAAALFLVAYLLESTWLQYLGAAYLLYLSIRYFTKKRNLTHSPKIHSFWKTVLLVELLDLVFAIDSILAGVAFIENNTSKLWIVYIGGMIGLLVMRYAAGLFSSLLDRFPRLETSAYLMVGWIGLKLALHALNWQIPPLLFWAFVAFFFLLGFLTGNRLKSKP